MKRRRGEVMKTVKRMSGRYSGQGHTCAKIVIIVFAFDSCTARRSICEDDGDSFFGGRAKKVSLLCAEWSYAYKSWRFNDPAKRTYPLSSVQVKPDR